LRWLTTLFPKAMAMYYARPLAINVLMLSVVAGSTLCAADKPATANAAGKTPAKPVVQPEEVVHPPLRTESPKANVQPRIVLKNDETASRLSISVDGAEALVYRYGKDLGFPRFYPIWSPSGKAMTVQEAPPYPHHQSFWFADTVELEGHRKASFYGAIYSHSENEYPHKWLTRDYGTFGPRRPDAQSGKPFTLAKGQSIERRVGVLVHSGDVKSGNVAELYKRYCEGKL
jgi:hypothetical protein